MTQKTPPDLPDGGGRWGRVIAVVIIVIAAAVIIAGGICIYTFSSF